jgi:DHA3 family tetracycline resistance protein-like MFS transporter
VAALLRGHLGLPTQPLTVVYVAWAATAFSLVGYALVDAVWEAMLVSFFSLACLTTGAIVWTTVLQRSVPAGMIGRVSSLDWVLSLGLAPVSYALIVPLSDALGARTTLLLAGIIGGAVMLFVLLTVSEVRDVAAIEDDPSRAAAAA